MNIMTTLRTLKQHMYHPVAQCKKCISFSIKSKTTNKRSVPAQRRATMEMLCDMWKAGILIVRVPSIGDRYNLSLYEHAGTDRHTPHRGSAEIGYG